MEKNPELKKLLIANSILWTGALLIHPILLIIPIGPDGDGPVPPFLHMIILIVMVNGLVASNRFIAKAAKLRDGK